MLSEYISCIKTDIHLYDMLSWRLKIKQSDITFSEWTWHGNIAQYCIGKRGKQKWIVWYFPLDNSKSCYTHLLLIV